MKIISSKNKLIRLIQKEKNVGFVPTMGAIHKAHISLIRKSIYQCNKTVVSIFINKPQFNISKDYKTYPRNLNRDISLLKKEKIDYLFLPRNKEIYPRGRNRNIKINSFKKKLCGKYRPGHFEAIVDVIDRFIKIIKPKKIYFGEKDMQQLIIIKDFIKKNHKKTQVIKCKTIRENNGIAYSSRNFNLTSNDKNIAAKIYNLIKKNKNKIIRSGRVLKIKKEILLLGIKKIDYIRLLDINKIVKPYKKSKNPKIFIAYYLNKTRLIDNI